jgi:hypothetical protein
VLVFRFFTASALTPCAAPRAQAELDQWPQADDPKWPLTLTKDALDEASVHSFGYGAD